MTQELLRARKFVVQRREYNVPGVGSVQGEVVVHPGAVLILPVLSPTGRCGTDVPLVNSCGTGVSPVQPELSSTEIVLIRNYRFSVEKELLELPAGTLEPGEEPAACAARELEEETGYAAERIEPLCRFYTSPGFTNELMHAFVATHLIYRGQKTEATEQIRVQAMSLQDALDACLDGRIMDGKTIAALQAYYYGRTKRS